MMRIFLAIILLLVARQGDVARAEEYPSKPVRLVVPFAAGGPSDVHARFLARALTKGLGKTVFIENVTGGGGNIGVIRAASSQPDGYTLLHANNIAMTVTPSLFVSPGFDALADFIPLGLTSQTPSVLLARADLPPKDLGELIRYVRENGDKVNFGTAGRGSPSHLGQLLFLNAIQGTATSVPYRGSAPAKSDLAAGQIDLLLEAADTGAPQLLAGPSSGVKSYGATSLKRLTTLPSLPTLDEQGLKGFEFSVWFGLFAPKNTPQAIVRHLVDAVAHAARDPEYVEALVKAGAESSADRSSESPAFRELIRRETVTWSELLTKAGVAKQ